MITEKERTAFDKRKAVGTKKTQGRLWGKKAEDWSRLQESTSEEGYQFVLKRLDLTPNDFLLDVGCGSGMFCRMAASSGAYVTGLDASVELLDISKQKAPAAFFMVGEMEDLPFQDESFDVVTGFNSFQYAGNIKNSFREAKRVLRNDGKLVVMIWGDKDECESSGYISVVEQYSPAPIPGTPGPFTLSENYKLEELLEDAGFVITSVTDIPSVWIYPDMDIALRAILSDGTSAKAIEHSGYPKVEHAVLRSLVPNTNGKGKITFHNKFRVVIASKKELHESISSHLIV